MCLTLNLKPTQNMPDTRIEDTDLMRKLVEGDRNSLGIIYDRYAGFVYRTAYRFLFNEEDARDITQSVFISLMQSAGRYRPEAKFTTWLYRITVNRCLNYKSSAHRRFRIREKENETLNIVKAPEEERPDLALERKKRIKRLENALLRLPERQRIAVILKRFEEMSYDEIALTLRCSKSSVESLLYRARQSLKKYFSE